LTACASRCCSNTSRTKHRCITLIALFCWTFLLNRSCGAWSYTYSRVQVRMGGLACKAKIIVSRTACFAFVYCSSWTKSTFWVCYVVIVKIGWSLSWTVRHTCSIRSAKQIVATWTCQAIIRQSSTTCLTRRIAVIANARVFICLNSTITWTSSVACI